MTRAALHVLAVLALVGCAGLETPTGPDSPHATETGTPPPPPAAESTHAVAGSAGGTLRYCPPGDLLGPGENGYKGREVYFSDLRFPIAFAASDHHLTSNSQMYMPGGYCSAGSCGNAAGSACELANFQPPWRDTFCEKAGRTYGTPLCPDGIGHQGLDIRVPVLISNETRACRRDQWDAVAVQDGTVFAVSGAVVKLRDRQGGTYTYRHLNPDSIREFGTVPGKEVRKGDRLGRIDQFNNAGTQRTTSLHLHLEATLRGSDGRTLHIPLYTSMLASYRRAVGLVPGLDAAGKLIVDRGRELTGGCG